MTARKAAKPAKDRLQRLSGIAGRIERFNRECQRKEHTDTGDVWDLLHWIKGEVRDLMNVPEVK